MDCTCFPWAQRTPACGVLVVQGITEQMQRLLEPLFICYFIRLVGCRLCTG